MAAHGVGIAFAIILAVVVYIGYKYMKAREKAREKAAAARDMEDMFARYNPEKDIVEFVRLTDHDTDVLTDNSSAFDVEGNEWPIVGMKRERGTPSPPSWAKYKEAMKRFKQL